MLQISKTTEDFFQRMQRDSHVVRYPCESKEQTSGRKREIQLGYLQVDVLSLRRSGSILGFSEGAGIRSVKNALLGQELHSPGESVLCQQPGWPPWDCTQPIANSAFQIEVMKLLLFQWGAH